MAPGTAEMILVVDDNETARYGKARTLRRAGFEVIEAENGQDAIRTTQTREPRLVVLDVNLPDLDGWEVCRRLKNDPATASVLVLQVSATYVREEDTVRALDGGADACLTEPIEPPVMVATVRALLRARRAEDALRDAFAAEQRARAVAESANRTKDEFLATLSHELRSPLGAILTWVTLLRSGRTDARQTARALEAIERNTRIQVKLIEDLLDVSRIISGKMRLDIALVDLAPVVEAALDSVRPAAHAKGISLESRVDPGVGPVAADAARLQQIVWNLLSNAVKFTPKNGRVAVLVETAQSQVHIQVADSGAGIDPAFLPHIFERFRQADSSTTRAESGLGLGLAIVRHLAELHGGTVEAWSPGLGHGATFSLRLPLPAVRHLPTDGDRDVVTSRTQERGTKLAGLRTLVVDDDGDARDAISAVLEDSGAHVTAVASAREALVLLASNHVDVLVSDIAMPSEDGYEFIAQVRRRQGADRRVPALALTAYASAAEQRRILGAGFDAYLAKPIEAHELAQAVARLAGRDEPDAR